MNRQLVQRGWHGIFSFWLVALLLTAAAAIGLPIKVFLKSFELKRTFSGSGKWIEQEGVVQLTHKMLQLSI